VVGDGAVGLCAVLAAAQLGAEQVIAMSRHEARQKLAVEFGATAIIAERDEAGAAKVRELTEGIGADAVLECVGTEGARLQALACARPGATIGTSGCRTVSCRQRNCSGATSAWPAGRPRCGPTCPS